MASLSAPSLTINPARPDGSPVDVLQVTTGVNVMLDGLDITLINIGALNALLPNSNGQALPGLQLQLECRLFGEDGGLRGGDDEVFNFPPIPITEAKETMDYTFKMDFGFRAQLNEDAAGDEIYAEFTLRSLSNISPLKISTRTQTVTGGF